ncbi:MAG: response regulator [Phycisphaerae bacterium]
MSSTRTLLIVEDEADLAELICYNAQREGFECRCVADGLAALEAVAQRCPDLIILDRMLPHVSGDEVADRLKRDPHTAGIPIIMLTAKVEESDQLVGFALGADDYVCKPFSMKVLLARAGAMLRRSDPAAAPAAVITAGPIRLDAGRHEVRIDDKSVALTATEFGLLRVLMSAGEQVMGREQLINRVLGAMVAVTDRTIDVHVAALRKKMGPAASWIQTVRGVGYTFRNPSD